MATIFTGQKIVGKDLHDPKHPYNEVECACCHRPVSLRVAYIDKYQHQGKELYVHYSCLSNERLAELEQPLT